MDTPSLFLSTLRFGFCMCGWGVLVLCGLFGLCLVGFLCVCWGWFFLFCCLLSFGVFLVSHTGVHLFSGFLGSFPRRLGQL